MKKFVRVEGSGQLGQAHATASAGSSYQPTSEAVASHVGQEEVGVGLTFECIGVNEARLESLRSVAREQSAMKQKEMKLMRLSTQVCLATNF